MRALLYVLLAVLWAPVAAGCLSAPRPEDWLAVGFRTPEQTFRSFQTGLRSDQPDLEYRCLSSAFKRQAGLTQLTYRGFRAELFRRRPWFKLAGGAEIRRVVPLGPGRVRIEAEVETWIHDERFEVELVREDYYELWVDGKRVDDDSVAWGRLAREQDDRLLISVPLQAPIAPDASRELRVGQEWKIDTLPLGADDAQP